MSHTTTSSSIRTVVAVTASLMMMIIIIPKRVRHTMTTIPFDRDHIVDAKQYGFADFCLSNRYSGQTVRLSLSNKSQSSSCTTVRTTVLGISY